MLNRQHDTRALNIPFCIFTTRYIPVKIHVEIVVDLNEYEN